MIADSLLDSCLVSCHSDPEEGGGFFGVLFKIGRGLARTQVPATRNCTVELLAFGVIAGVSPSVVQCKSLALEEAPW